jgi:hypothetical protein
MIGNYCKDGPTETIGYFRGAQRVAAPAVRHFR